MNPCRFIFVYGTLRKQSPHEMARFLEQRCPHVGTARTAGRLYDLGPFPAMLPAERPQDWVWGDVYEVNDADDTLADLDRYEGVASEQHNTGLFHRGRAEVVLETGQKVEAWLYWYGGEVQAVQRVHSGDYFAR